MKTGVIKALVYLGLLFPVTSCIDSYHAYDFPTQEQCGLVLNLTCKPDQVAAGEIHGAVTSGGHNTCTEAHCVCPTEPDCLAPSLVPNVKMCLWTKSSCFINGTQSKITLASSQCGEFVGSYLVAKPFHCIYISMLYDICQQPVISADEGFITSPGYPSRYQQGLNCTLTIMADTSKIVKLQILASHMPKHCADYLEITNRHNEAVQSICGHVTYDTHITWLLHGGPVILRFHSRPLQKHYAGFVLHFKVTADDPHQNSPNSLPVHLQSIACSHCLTGCTCFAVGLIAVLLSWMMSHDT